MTVANAVAIPALIMTLGVSVNFARAELGKEKLQSAIDTAALTLARAENSGMDANKVIQASIDANLANTVLAPDDVTFSYTIEDGLNGRVVTIIADATVDLAFSGGYKFDDISFSLKSSAAVSVKEIEAALVLDVSGSMAGGKIANLKEAAISFVDEVLSGEVQQQNTLISLVPFGGLVNLGDKAAPLMHSSVDTTNWSGCPDFDQSIMNDDLVDLGSLYEMPAWYPYGYTQKYCVESAEAQFLKNDPEFLRAQINGYEALGAATGTDFGATWGLKALSPDWQGRFPGAPAGKPEEYSEPMLKALIIMTDGAITHQWRPDEDYPYYYPYSDLKWWSSTGRQNFAAICEDAKSKGNIIVYTIGFEVYDTTTRDMLRACATSPDHYYTPEGTDLVSTFQTIARQLNDLRLTE